MIYDGAEIVITDMQWEILQLLMSDSELSFSIREIAYALSLIHIYTVMGIVKEYSYSGFSKCFTLPEQLMNEATGIDCTGTISVITDTEKFDMVEAALNLSLIHISLWRRGSD